jgi:hypothetical protein
MGTSATTVTSEPVSPAVSKNVEDQTTPESEPNTDPYAKSLKLKVPEESRNAIEPTLDEQVPEATLAADAPIIASEAKSEPKAELPLAPAPRAIPVVGIAENTPERVVEPIEPIPVIPAPKPNPSSEPAPQTGPSAAEVEDAADKALASYALIYALIRDGQNTAFKGDAATAKVALADALEKLLVLQKEHPTFEPFMVEYRIRDVRRKLNALLGEKTNGPAEAME